MDTNTLLTIIAVFTGVAAFSMLAQFITVVALYLAAKKAIDQVTPLIPKVNGILATTQSTLDQSKQHIMDITAKANDLMDTVKLRTVNILDDTKRQMTKVEGLVDDASSRAKTQLDRAEMVLDDTVTRVHESVSAVQNGILKPIREVQGVTNGVRAALQQLTRSNRGNQGAVPHDGEMFI